MSRPLTWLAAILAVGMIVWALFTVPSPAQEMHFLTCRAVGMAPSPTMAGVDLWQAPLTDQLLDALKRFVDWRYPHAPQQAIAVTDGDKVLIILRTGNRACALPPVDRSAYEAARRAVLGKEV